MMAGAPALGFIVRTGGAPFLEGTLPVDVDGTTYPASDAALFTRINNGGTAAQMWSFTGDFPNAGVGAAFTPLPNVALGPFDRVIGSGCGGFPDCVPQPAPCRASYR